MDTIATNKVKYAFRRPRFPVICADGNELISAESSAEFQRQVKQVELRPDKVLDMVDATGEGWVFHCDLMIVSPFTIRKQWKKVEVINMFNESDNARRVREIYPAAYIPRRSLARIIAEIAYLVKLSRKRSRRGSMVDRNDKIVS